MTEAKSTILYFTEGSSNKEYRAQLVQEGDGWVVNFQYGPRGRATNSGTKTKDPLPYDKALKTYDKLVKSKTDKGYTPDVSGAAYSGGEKAGLVTTFRPQLLNAVSREHGLSLDDGWFAQEKHDGERRGVICTRDGEIIFANRKGLQVAVQQQIADAVAAIHRELPEGFSLDAEDMGDHLVIFDLPDWPGQWENAPFAQRVLNMLDLQELVDRHGVGNVLKIDHATRFDIFKRDRLPKIEARGGEGYVLKDPRAPYSPDRPSSGGPALKVKFVERATCRVQGANGTKRSVALELMNADGVWTGVGNVTIPSNQNIPETGELVEVEYLYAYEGGSLFQPVCIGKRTDLDEAACTMAQLKFKGAGLAAEPEVESLSL